jgi:hypothetical protein
MALVSFSPMASISADYIAEFQSCGMSYSGCIAEFEPDGIAEYQE